MATENSASVKEAENILRGKSADVRSMLELSENLKGEKAFGLARRILAIARDMKPDDEKLADKLRQQHALCTYKDPDLPVNNRLDRALQILGEGEDLRETKSQETLGLAGAIYKRKWELLGGKQILERSLSYYLRGYQEGPAGDQGYTGINAAFLLDLLATMETAEAKETGSSIRMPARAVRRRSASVNTWLACFPPSRVKRVKSGWKMRGGFSLPLQRPFLGSSVMTRPGPGFKGLGD